MPGETTGTVASAGAGQGLTFLEMVQRLHTEAALSGSAPSSVVDQTGQNLRLVNWINSAYEAIQAIYKTWLFRRGEFSFTTISGTANYSPAAAGITDLEEWLYYPYNNRASGIRLYSAITDEGNLAFLPWDDFKAIYLSGSARVDSNRPTVFTIKFNKSIQLAAIPDAGYNVNGEYIKSIDVLDVTNNDDTPLFDDYNMIIVWRALMFFGGFEGAPEVSDMGEIEYKNLLMRLRIAYLPRMGWGPSLV